ncbi:uncharacterized protein LOC114759496 [Neltuma alba]|uniref:uncharacterized protein LOC114736354 n=1 Tax=Neltuma alba TaxID=207710 RepID=UPI0010A31BC3|nr:uncharacterized protein LOC114736354 [Prosopis alba]XP_028804507.1 uncharacterized protein LOC114759496 [Prosopis alba]
MAEINVSLQRQQSHESNPSLRALFHALDPISLILNQNSNSDCPVPLKLTSADSFIMERGPRYEAYAELREAKLRRKYARAFEEDEEPKRATPPRKQVKFQTNLASGRKGSSVLAQSVPDFSAALRKENRKPTNTLPSLPEMTPPAKSFSKANNGVLSNSRGSKSASAGEKKGGNGRVLMARKSYANIDELKSLSSYAANAINGEARGGRSNGYGGGRVVGNGKNVFGYRQY